MLGKQIRDGSIDVGTKMDVLPIHWSCVVANVHPNIFFMVLSVRGFLGVKLLLRLLTMKVITGFPSMLICYRPKLLLNDSVTIL